MLYFIENKAIDATIKEIRRKIRTSMNGETVSSMRAMGVLYKQNFGVSIPRIKEIASKYEPNHDLAQRLWAIDSRETKIMATLLQPIQDFKPETAEKWLLMINQMELVEQISMNLLSKLPYAAEISTQWIHQENYWLRLTGFTVIARIWNKFNVSQIEQIIAASLQYSVIDDFQLYKSIAVALSRLCRYSEETAKTIFNKIEHFENSENISEKYIFNEVRGEMDVFYGN